MPCDVLQPLALEPERQLVDGDHRRVGRARDTRRRRRSDPSARATAGSDRPRSIRLRCPAGTSDSPSSQGSVTIRLPPGVVMMNVEWPSQVIESCSAMTIVGGARS